LLLVARLDKEKDAPMLKSVEIDRGSLPTGIFCGLLAALIWGAWPVASRFGVQATLTAYDITATRFAVAGVIMLPLVLRRGIVGIGWPGALVLALGAGAPYVIVALSGFVFAPAGHGGVIIPSCMLTFSTLGGWLILGDRPDRARLLGLAAILSGVMMIGWDGLAEGGNDAWIGDALFVLAGLLWAIYTVASRAWAVEPLHATALVSVISMVAFLPVYLVFGESRLLVAPVSEVVLEGVFQGLFAGVLALLFYTRSVSILGAARGAVFAALVPGIAVFLAYPLLGEVPGRWQLLGVGVVTLGMIAALGLYRSPRAAADRGAGDGPAAEV
jgi:drug/metabolite transporter (DMT)-like permease